MLNASKAAFFALSIPTAPTGIPGGICAIESNASNPSNLELTGTPIIGFTVLEAQTPGNAADKPAIAIITSALVFFTISSTLSGFLCADATSNWYSTPNAFITFSAFSAISESLLLPIMISTFAIGENWNVCFLKAALQILFMVKADALRKRYILFQIKGIELPEQQLKRALYAEAAKFFGEYGLSFAALKLVKFNEKKNQGIIRCERSHLEQTLGMLALINFLDRKPARVVALKSSGTIATLNELEK